MQNINPKNNISSINDFIKNTSSNNQIEKIYSYLEKSPEVDTLTKENTQKNTKENTNKNKLYALLGLSAAALVLAVCIIKRKFQPDSKTTQSLTPTIKEKEESLRVPTPTPQPIPSVITTTTISTKGSESIPTIISLPPNPSKSGQIVSITPETSITPKVTLAPAASVAPQATTPQATIPSATTNPVSSITPKASTPQPASTSIPINSKPTPIPSQIFADAIEKEIAEKIGTPIYFDNELFNSFTNIEKTMFTSDPFLFSVNFANSCRAEQERLEELYLKLHELKKAYKVTDENLIALGPKLLSGFGIELTQDDKIVMRINEKIEDIVRRHEKLSHIVSMKEILEIKDKIGRDEYSRILKEMIRSYERLPYEGLDTPFRIETFLSILKDKAGIGIFKNSPVYQEILAAANKLGFEGSENEKIKQLLAITQRSENSLEKHPCILFNDSYRIPETNLIITRRWQKPLPSNLDDFIYTENISQSTGFSGLLAKATRGNEYEIRRYVEPANYTINNPQLQKTVANIEQEAYNTLLDDITRMLEYGYTNKLGITVDDKTQKFTPTYPTGYIITYLPDKLPGIFINPIANLIESLGVSKYTDVNSFKKILAKILKATALDINNFKRFKYPNNQKAVSTSIKMAIEDINYKEYMNFVDEKAISELDEAFAKLSELKLQFTKNKVTKTELDNAIEKFCLLVDEKLTDATDHKHIAAVLKNIQDVLNN